jgi:hypothetical protein
VKRSAKRALARKKNARSKTRAAPKVVAEKLSTADEQAAAMETWRSRESGRFSERKGPFNSFDSPPGRF